MEPIERNGMKTITSIFMIIVMVSVAGAEIVNIDLTANANVGPTGYFLGGVTGAVNPTWNPVSATTPFTDLLDEDGNPTEVDFQLTGTVGGTNTAGAFAFGGGGAATGFFNSYAFLHASGNPGSYDISSFKISGLVAGGVYDLYFYATWHWIDAGSEFRISSDGGSNWSAWKLCDGIPSIAEAPFSEGHSYVVFTNAVADTNGEILGQWQTTLAGNSPNHRGMFNALQIESKPGPVANPARHPGPENGAAHVATTTNLQWDAGLDPNNLIRNPDVTKYYVYIMETEIGGDPNFTGISPTVAPDTVDDNDPVTLLNASLPLVLRPDKKYHWRVDQSIHDSGPADPGTIPGPVWSFQTVRTFPLTTFIEQNSSGNDRLRSTGNDVDLVPAGTTGNDVTWQQIEASPGYYYVQNLDNGKRLRAVDAATVDLADAGTTGSAVEWLVEDHDGTWSFVLSRSQGTKLHASSAIGWDVNLAGSQFTGVNVQWKGLSPGPPIPTASTPSPTHTAIDIHPNVTFSWVGEDVSDPTYFMNIGTTPDCNDVLFNHSVGSSTNYFADSILDNNTSYCWRIDIMDGGKTYLGDVWEFTTSDGTLWVDDFFDYADTNDLLATWQPVGGAVIAYEPLTNIVSLNYDNTEFPFTSEVARSFSPPVDWHELSTLNLSMLGRSVNSVEPVFVTLTDGILSHTIQLPDVSTLQEKIWQGATVQLIDFAEQGLDLSSITAMTIGLGSGSAGGTGTVYFNDVVLYPPRCLAQYAAAADLTRDCNVDLDDLIIMAEVWLDRDFTVFAVAPPAPVASYAFEETTGYIAFDGQGSGHATITPVTADGFWNAAGQSNRCLLLADPNLEVTFPAEVFAAISSAATISLWIHGEAAMVPDPIETVELLAGTAPVQAHNWDRLRWDIVSSDQYEGWNHYALVKDDNENKLQIYVNGILVAQKLDASGVLSGALAGQTILSLTAGLEVAPVKVDELQIYNVALSQAEIVHLAKGTSGQVVQPIGPILTHADIAGHDGVVNLPDLAQLAMTWLTDQKW